MLLTHHEIDDPNAPAGFHTVFVKRQCMHCDEPACVSACPVSALEKTAEGPVVYDANKCIGCRYCMLACPFGAISSDWSSLAPKVSKCTLCADRLPVRRADGAQRRGAVRGGARALHQGALDARLRAGVPRRRARLRRSRRDAREGARAHRRQQRQVRRPHLGREGGRRHGDAVPLHRPVREARAPGRGHRELSRPQHPGARGGAARGRRRRRAPRRRVRVGQAQGGGGAGRGGTEPPRGVRPGAAGSSGPRRTCVLAAIMAFGAFSFVARFALGLGGSTRLSDTWGWGLWIVFDLVWIAVAAGAFATAGIIYVLRRKDLYSLGRSAVLIGLLSYSFVTVTLVADLGLPWHFWQLARAVARALGDVRGLVVRQPVRHDPGARVHAGRLRALRHAAGDGALEEGGAAVGRRRGLAVRVAPVAQPRLDGARRRGLRPARLGLPPAARARTGPGAARHRGGDALDDAPELARLALPARPGQARPGLVVAR